MASRKQVKAYADQARTSLRRAVRQTGFDIVRRRPGFDTAGMDALAVATIRETMPFTMTDPAKVFGLIQSVRYVVNNAIPGDIAECGVWAGGSMMAAARTLLQLGDTSRHLYLFDTFEGTTPPTNADISPDGQTAEHLLANSDPDDPMSAWSIVPMEQVGENVAKIGYPEDKIHFVRGMVEETVPEQAPDRLALLRLDTDWYESTRHEMEHLFPRISPGGVLIVDDYGWWKGAQQAVDAYIATHRIPLLLTRLGPEGGAIGVVPAAGAPAPTSPPAFGARVASSQT
ncbi:class I SAM-dependent methyltransferase [Frankia sp. CNm7]|uniref:Class I SAM-dependent methyltransferase n=1 Tax=Frankia nepalensis TaxID=1836974 RepID=A0A937RHE5_9ACTN|nr:TylF/MycF/NovP-related O-methyltransferase [Frankia nepalensis]MBL7497705.1 class I SAM-dependent methyltransferase [Frankia nepalensis]MBL7514291.1 class I SAM-dependent methyltransferase [Frankia nepalensis]MBL7519380.1 class I SAM-dependent methyltransferase [Frankia nepalensis]MBL7630247.1 class I SAM-dependent methyltransferase [Frankia nepalensis]